MAAKKKAGEAKERRREHGLFPSSDVDVDTALQLFDWSHYRFARSTEALPPELIARVLAALVKQRKGPAVLFLQTAVDERDLQPTWRAAVNALKGFQSDYAWGSKEKRRVLEGAAKNARLLAATQAATVGSDKVPDAYLAVLALDGGDASLDALMPHFDRALKDPSRLDALEKVARFASKSSPGLAALLARVETELQQRKEGAPSLQLARRLGFTDGPRFRIDLGVSALGDSEVALQLRVDSASPHDFTLWVMKKPFTPGPRTILKGQVVEEDSLGLGPCTVEQLPDYLARAQAKLKVRWDTKQPRASYLKGKRLEAFLAWLLAPSETRRR